jgi:site-specific DNA recombinase
MVSIKGSLAAYEIAKMKERIKLALERSVIDGKAGGGAVLNYGYCKGGNKILQINEDEARVVRLIYDFALTGMGTKRIANELNNQKIPTKRSNIPKGRLKIKGVVVREFVWRDSTIYRILTNSIYCGEREFKGRKYNSPAIIEKNKFMLVQELLKDRKHYVNTTNKYSYLLKGLIICPICKNLFYGRKRADLSDNQYVCCSQRYSEFCGNRGINIDKIDNIIWKSILELPKRIKSLVVDKNDEYVIALKNAIDNSKATLFELENRKNKLVEEIYRSPKLSSIFRENLNTLADNIEYETKNLQDKERQLEMSNQHSSLVKTLESQISPFNKKKVNIEEKQRVVRSLISFIVVKWSEERGEHLIWTQFRISELSDLQIQGLSKVSYHKSGFTYKENKIVYEFRLGSQKAEVSNTKEGGREYSFTPGVLDEYFTIEDFTDKEYENFKELIWKARKRKRL